MKRNEIRPCSICGKGVAHTGVPLFYRIKVERLGIDLNAVKRLHGLEMMLGSPVRANVMGPDEDLAKPITEYELIVCESCADEKRIPIGALYEYAPQEEEEEEDDGDA